MILLRIAMHARPEKHKEVFQTLQSMIRKSVMDTGCLNFSIGSDIENDHLFSLTLEWETLKDLNRYLLSDQFTVLLGTRSLLKESMAVQIMTVLNVEGMEVIHSLRNKKSH